MDYEVLIDPYAQIGAPHFSSTLHRRSLIWIKSQNKALPGWVLRATASPNAYGFIIARVVGEGPEPSPEFKQAVEDMVRMRISQVIP